MKFLQFDENGVLSGRYLSDSTNIPDGCIEVTDEFCRRTIDETDGIWMLDQDGQITKHPFPPPTPEEIALANKTRQAGLISNAAQAMAPVMAFVNLGNATGDEIELAKKWQAYYRALQEVDVYQETPEWPEAPE